MEKSLLISSIFIEQLFPVKFIAEMINKNKWKISDTIDCIFLLHGAEFLQKLQLSWKLNSNEFQEKRLPEIFQLRPCLYEKLTTFFINIYEKLSFAKVKNNWPRA